MGPALSNETRRKFRVHARKNLRLAVSITHAVTGWKCDARVTNVGLGGVGIDLAQPLEVGDRLLVDIMAPSLWDPLHLTARVVWVKENAPETVPTGSRAAAPPGRSAGLAFEHAAPEGVFALFELVADAVF